MPRLWGAAVSAAVLLAVLQPGRALAAPSTETTLAWLDEARAALGAPPLKLAEDLNAIAQAHAERHRRERRPAPQHLLRTARCRLTGRRPFRRRD